MVRWRVQVLPGLAALSAATMVMAGCGSTASSREAAPAGASAGGTATTTAAPTLVVRSFDGTVSYVGERPTTIGLSRDATNIVSHLTWSSWGPRRAVGHGLLGIDDCKPDCASGTVTEVLTTIQLDDVVSGHFTAMTEKSGSLDRSYSYPSAWATSAS